MARKKVIDLNADTTIKFGKAEGALRKGSTFEGYYVGSKEVDSGMGPSKLHIFQTDEGNVGVWGSAQLNAKLTNLNGMHTWIKFVDEVRVPKGTMKVFEVEYDDEDTIEVGGTEINFRPTNAAEQDDSDGDSLDQDSEDSTDDLDTAAEEDLPPVKSPPRQSAPASRPAAAARTASPEQQAKVNAILGKRK